MIGCIKCKHFFPLFSKFGQIKYWLQKSCPTAVIPTGLLQEVPLTLSCLIILLKTMIGPERGHPIFYQSIQELELK